MRSTPRAVLVHPESMDATSKTCADPCELLHVPCGTVTIPRLGDELARLGVPVDRLPCGACRVDAPRDEWVAAPSTEYV